MVAETSKGLAFLGHEQLVDRHLSLEQITKAMKEGRIQWNRNNDCVLVARSSKNFLTTGDIVGITSSYDEYTLGENQLIPNDSKDPIITLDPEAKAFLEEARVKK